MKKTYKITSEEAQVFAASQNVQAEVDGEAEIELTVSQEKAMIAAGWIEHPKQPKEAKS